jgi:5-methylcytosine-specific restriction endonuclease McrA
MPNILGNTHTEEARAKMSASAKLVQAQPERREKQRLARIGWVHSAETKAKMSATFLRKLAEDPAYAAMRRENARRNSLRARQKFLAALAGTNLVLAEIPLSKEEKKMLRAFHCAICRTLDRPRQLAHIVARSQGGPQRHTWGNAIPLCAPCHAAVDHGKVT